VIPALRLAAAALAAACLCTTAGALAGGGGESAPGETPRVLARRHHDPLAFTQGLLLSRGTLYESTGLYGASSVRRLDAATGRVLERRDLPRRFFGEGMSLCGEDRNARLVQLTWREGVMLLHNADTLRTEAERPLRGEGWGLACRGREAWLSDGSDVLRVLDAGTLAETGRELPVRNGGLPVQRLNELEWVNGWLVANIWQEDRIAIIDPEDGRVALWLDIAPLRAMLGREGGAANGVAFDPEADAGRGALLLTGKRWDTLFVVALPDTLRHPPARRTAGRHRPVAR
jgi:glutamine cyclotransferase